MSAEAEDAKNDIISKEEAIKKYKASLSTTETDIIDDEIIDEGAAPEIVESEFSDDTEVLAGGAAEAESYNNFDNNQVEEYNPDDEEDDLDRARLLFVCRAFGWVC